LCLRYEHDCRRSLTDASSTVSSKRVAAIVYPHRHRSVSAAVTVELVVKLCVDTLPSAVAAAVTFAARRDDDDRRGDCCCGSGRMGHGSGDGSGGGDSGGSFIPRLRQLRRGVVVHSHRKRCDVQ
jgi:uncharacterized membrane protein YgcG